jgi:sensor histidine kinase YesM
MMVADNMVLSHLYLRFLFLGALLSVTFYAFLRYLLQKDRTALFYTLYAFCIFIYFVFQLRDYREFTCLKFTYEPLNDLSRSGLLNLAFIIYFFFASSFLDGRKRYPRLDRVVITITKINLGIWCLSTLLSFIIPHSFVLTILNYIIFSLIIIMALTGTIALARYWSYLERFFVAGVLALIFSGLYNWFITSFDLFGHTSFYFIFSTTDILIVSILIELFTYAIAMGYKSKRERNRAVALEKYWVRELETNRQLQEKLHASMLKYQEQLEREVRERTEEITRKSNELQQEKLQKVLEEYKRAALESELKALRTQINPHFLFNCMNILSSFVIRDMKEEAMDFILKFSRLMRLVLENSIHHKVRIDRDIEALKLYVHLEAIRYDHSFKYQFKIDPKLLTDDYRIPPMLLQPYVENAIRHGLGNKESGERLLTIILQLDGSQIVCEIIDNGIGRQNAAMLKARSPEKAHQSLGMKVTESRITLLQELSNGRASVDIQDLQGEENGTIIRITLPAK